MRVGVRVCKRERERNRKNECVGDGDMECVRLCVHIYCTKLEVKFTSADIFNFVLKYFYILKWIFDKYQRTL